MRIASRAGAAAVAALAAALLALALVACPGGGGERIFLGIADPRPFHEEDTRVIADLAASIIDAPDPAEFRGLTLRVEGLLRETAEGLTDGLEDSIDREIKLKRLVALSCAFALLLEDGQEAFRVLNAAEASYLALDPADFADRGGFAQVRLINAVRGRISGRQAPPLR